MSCFIVRSEIRKDKGVVVVKRIYDVIVAGAGPGGMTAALSAARNGMKVLLIDRNGCPGGMNTSGMAVSYTHLKGITVCICFYLCSVNKEGF